MTSKVFISNDVLHLLRSYINNSHEVGGALFGVRLKFISKILSISFKHGGKGDLCFTDSDYKLFYPPENMILLGSWHTHLGNNYNVPSMIDLNQWQHWDSSYIHLIISDNKYCAYNASGKKLALIKNMQRSRG